MKKRKTFILVIIISIALLTMLFTKNLFFPTYYSNEDFQIQTYTSQIDQDQDGIDDQTDILNNTKEYLKTKPKYKSKYYANGYPDDEYGVCTDVVAFALLNAGYDIQKLLNEDVMAHKELYNIETIDKNIDFRRVLNLNTYFSRNAISLTTDTQKIEEWQGGDIVVFEKHIGIISDHRTKKGTPYVLHHASPFQMNYEENILNKQKIIGHYRIS